MYWWQIGVGLIFYKILVFLGLFLGFMIVFPFVMNFFTGTGYGHNAKKVWHAFFWIMKMGTAKRSKNEA